MLRSILDLRSPPLFPADPVLMADVRRMPVGNYLVLYRVGDDCVKILRVLHSAGDMRDLVL